MPSPHRITPDELLERYDGLLLDAYGVLMTEAGPLPGAPGFIDRLHRLGMPFCILTNDAAKLPATTSRRLQGMGIDVPADRVVTSGSLLAPHFARHGLQGAACAVLGPPDSVRYVVDAGGEIVPAQSDFDVLVIGDESGFDFIESMDAALTSLFARVDRGRPVHLVVPNPDLVYPAGVGAFGFAAGTLAAMFEGALALRYPDRDDLRFARLGKPHAAIFDEGLRRIGTRNAAMIGDTLETDIRGANDAGIDAVLIGTGVSTPDWATTRPELRPVATIASFAP
jgi:HAD superfamily hydrolase (TIGR01450 family)